jgi:NAD(P)H-flavin reductase
MQESQAIIERIWQVSSELQRLELTVEPHLAQLYPGQSLLVLPDEDQVDPYLRQQWIPVNQEEGQLIIERSTQEHYQPGQVVSVVGPVGNALPWVGGNNKRLLLIALETSPMPLLMLASQALSQMSEVALVLLGKAAEYPFVGIPPAVEVINGTGQQDWQDRDATLYWADQIFTVADETFWLDHFTSLFQLLKNVRGHVPVNFLYGVFTLPMPCGVGACMACAVRCKGSMKLTCTQGPALDLTEVHLL